MYVCVCHALTTADVETARGADAPAAKLAALRRTSGRGCGTCAPRLRDLLGVASSESEVSAA
jgi:bacterioferritin-associated ferredoxin